jgi:hypothetical protein
MKNPGAYLTRVYLARYVPSSGLLPSRRFASPENGRPCFMPTTLMGFSLQSFSLDKEQANLSDFAFALLPLPDSNSFANAASGISEVAWNPTRLQGLDPLSKCVTRMAGATLQLRAGALLGFSPLQGFPPSRDSSWLPKNLPFRNLSGIRFPRPEFPPYSIQVSLNGKVGLVSKNLPTLMRFSPSNVLINLGQRRSLELLPGFPGCVSVPCRCSP